MAEVGAKAPSGGWGGCTATLPPLLLRPASMLSSLAPSPARGEGYLRHTRSSAKGAAHAHRFHGNAALCGADARRAPRGGARHRRRLQPAPPPRAARQETAEEPGAEIGRAHVFTPVTNAHLVCRLLLEQKKNTKKHHN